MIEDRTTILYRRSSILVVYEDGDKYGKIDDNFLGQS